MTTSKGTKTMHSYLLARTHFYLLTFYCVLYTFLSKVSPTTGETKNKFIKDYKIKSLEKG